MTLAENPWKTLDMREVVIWLDRGGRAWTAVALCCSIVVPHGFPTCTRHENDNETIRKTITQRA